MINSFTTETYEYLHKEWVKKPYRRSNKRDATLQMLNTVRRQSIIKHLIRIFKSISKLTTLTNKQSASIINGKIATFKLSSFDEFVVSYKSTNLLASEAIEAFNQFLPALDRFFDLLDELTENKMNDDTTIFIKWYSSATISSRDTIHAISNWYHQAAFDNISINMNSDEIEDYTTHDGMCFGKVILMLIVGVIMLIIMIIHPNYFIFTNRY